MMKRKNNQTKKIKQPAPSLLKVLLFDIFIRHWLVSSFAILFVIFSMILVNTSHQNRRLTAELQTLKQTHQEQQILWESLRLELTTLSEANRISNLAKKELGMVEVTTKNEKVISL